METVIAHEIESEVAGPPPRTAHLPWGTRALLTLAGALVLLLLLGGLRALEECGRLAWAAVGGRTVAARVIEVETAPAGTAGLSALQTGFRYGYADPFTGRTFVRHSRLQAVPSAAADPALGLSGSARVPPPPRLFVGERLTLRVAEGPLGSAVYFWSPAPWGKGVFLALCGLVVMSVGLRLALALARWSRHRLRLLRAGQAVVGTIIHKHTDVHDTARYYVRYGYVTVGACEACECEERISPEQWKAFEIGQPVTVLYDPDRPVQAGLYTLMK